MKPYESHESEENYLEAILMLSLDHRKVRAIDIANMLGFSKPSVSIALKRLKEEGKVESDEKEHLRKAYGSYGCTCGSRGECLYGFSGCLQDGTCTEPGVLWKD